MQVLEGILIAVISSVFIYLVKRHDDLDKRIDLIERHLIKIETKLPKRRNDDPYFSPNSGIEL